jgi:hypothetical protein
MSSLIGVWSADARYGPGAASDEVLWFCEDGRGRIDWENWVTCSVEFFDWEQPRDGIVRIRGRRILLWTEAGVEERQPFVSVPTDHAYAITREECPNRQVLEVLRIDLAARFVDADAFARTSREHLDFDNPHLGLP